MITYSFSNVCAMSLRRPNDSGKHSSSRKAATAELTESDDVLVAIAVIELQELSFRMMIAFGCDRVRCWFLEIGSATRHASTENGGFAG